MGIINQLDIQVANMIAAGEVVDRPSSVIKELLENAIDAGAKSITVEIKRGGTALMRVTDNGCGMSADDVPLCILRHATSKIKEQRDLVKISTLGFRGEALAAISSVSRLRIISRLRGERQGTQMEVEYGDIVSIEQTGAQVGTTVVVEELFANVPARRRFLKRDAAEAAACYAVTEKLALSHPEIAFKFISDGVSKLNTDGKNHLKDTVYAVLGRDFSAKTIKLHNMLNGVSVDGIIGSPENVRSNRNYQNIFLNGRFVRSRTIISAFEQAYDSFIPSDKFPCCVMFVEMDPVFVDVNVHPSKLEVKFFDEHMVFDAVYAGVRNAIVRNLKRPELVMSSPSVSEKDIRLASAFVPVFDKTEIKNKERTQSFRLTEAEYSGANEPKTAPEASNGPTREAPSSAPQNIPLPFDTPKEANKPPMLTHFSKETEAAPPSPTVEVTEIQAPETQEPAKALLSFDTPYIPRASTFTPVKEDASVLLIESSPESKPQTVDYKNISPERRESLPAERRKIEYRIIGQAFNSYVMVETEGKLLLIDKHAAHERIIFEQMKRNMQKSLPATQFLLVKYPLTLEASEYAAAVENRELLQRMGYTMETEDSERTLYISGYPAELDENAAFELLARLASQLADGTGNATVTREQFLEKALYQASCKAAIKAGQTEDEGHIKWICDNLLALPDIMYCPHGRPVAIEMTQGQIEKQFKRS